MPDPQDQNLTADPLIKLAQLKDVNDAVTKLTSLKLIGDNEARVVKDVFERASVKYMQINLDLLQNQVGLILLSPLIKTQEGPGLARKSFEANLAPILLDLNRKNPEKAAEGFSTAFGKASGFICDRKIDPKTGKLEELHPLAADLTDKEAKGFGTLNKPKNLSATDLIANIERLSSLDKKIEAYQRALEQAEANRSEVYKRRNENRTSTDGGTTLTLPVTNQVLVEEIKLIRISDKYKMEAEELLEKKKEAAKESALKSFKKAAEAHPFFAKP